MHAVPLAVAGLAVVIASCGGQPFPQSAGTPTTTRSWADSNPAATQNPRAVLLASVQRTSALKTAHVALSEKLVGLSGEAMTMSGTGAIDFTTKEMALSLQGHDNGVPISIELRVVGGTVYTGADGSWVSTPVSSTHIDSPNPGNYLAYLQGVSSNVRVEGHETLRGVDTTRYSATVDLVRAISHAVNPEQRTLFSQALGMFGGANVTIPTTVWVDADGHVRKLQLSIDVGPVLRREGVPVTGVPKLVVAVELYDFGVPVHVAAPEGAADAPVAAQDRAAQSDVRNALTAEKTVYVDSQMYSADLAQMKEVESALDWGGRLKVVVGNADGVRDAVVCLSESSKTGSVFSIGDVAYGPYAGTYYGRSACPGVVDDVSMSRLASHW